MGYREDGRSETAVRKHITGYYISIYFIQPDIMMLGTRGGAPLAEDPFLKQITVSTEGCGHYEVKEGHFWIKDGDLNEYSYNMSIIESIEIKPRLETIEEAQARRYKEYAANVG